LLIPSQPLPATAAPSFGPGPGGSSEGGPPPGGAWTPAQAQAMTGILSACQGRLHPAGSIEIAELLRQGVPEAPGAAQAGAEAVSLLAPPGPVSVSSPAAPPAEVPPARQFWFNINADLVIYGGTEPDAIVTLGGRPIPLRPDGTFSCRFTLPDGIFALTAEAFSADGAEGRLAELCFSRLTRYEGEVGEHPPEPGLQPPRVEALE
jgi:hypothetical protein